MLIVALTGGIGSGKSHAGQYFAQLGAIVVDSDQLARDVVESRAIFTSNRTNFASRLENSLAKCEPIPPAPPVITMTLSAKLNFIRKEYFDLGGS